MTDGDNRANEKTQPLSFLVLCLDTDITEQRDSISKHIVKHASLRVQILDFIFQLFSLILIHANPESLIRSKGKH